MPHCVTPFCRQRTQMEMSTVFIVQANLHSHLRIITGAIEIPLFLDSTNNFAK
jgi:hypothetical protein